MEVNDVVLKMMYQASINWDKQKLQAQLGRKSKYDPPFETWPDYPPDDKDRYPAAAAA